MEPIIIYSDCPEVTQIVPPEPLVEIGEAVVVHFATRIARRPNSGETATHTVCQVGPEPGVILVQRRHIA